MNGIELAGVGLHPFGRFGATPATVGLLFAAGRVLSAFSHIAAAWLAKRIGLIKTMVYTHPKVASYYKNAAGKVPTLYGFRIVDYWKWTNRPNPDDYELRR